MPRESCKNWTAKRFSGMALSRCNGNIDSPRGLDLRRESNYSISGQESATRPPRMPALKFHLALPPPTRHPRCSQTKVDHDDNDHGATRAVSAGLGPANLDRDAASSCYSCVCAGLLFLVGSCRLHSSALADRWNRHLPGLSPTAHS